MVLGGLYISKSKNYFFFKYFFQLWKWWISSGGRSKGKKIFRGMVAYKRNYFFLFNYYYSIWNTPGIIQTIIKNLKMNFLSGIVFYPTLGLFSLNILEQQHEVTSFLFHDTTTNHKYIWGNSIFLKNANIGTVFFAVQSQFSKKVLFARSSGTYSKIIKKSTEKIYVQLPSSLIYAISKDSSGTLGLSAKTILWVLTKAGQSWYIYWIPKVRGIAMNPVDHPHGGRTNKGCHPVTPTGYLTKGVKTRKKNSWSKNRIYAPRTKHN